MKNTHSVLEEIWNRYFAGEKGLLESDVLSVLSGHNIKLRVDDGVLKQVTISKPTTIENTFVIGLRYIKKGGTYTEDHFMCRNDQASCLEPVEMERHYKGRLERKLQEYKGTHKEQIDPARLAIYDSTITQVNTISYFIGEK